MRDKERGKQERGKTSNWSRVYKEDENMYNTHEGEESREQVEMNIEE